MPTSANDSKDQPENRNLKALTNIRLKNRKRSIIAQLKISSIRNNVDFLCSEISPNLNLLTVSETKLDDSFPTTQFLMSGFFKPYKLGRFSNGEGLLLYIRGDITSRSINHLKKQKNYLWKLISERRNGFFAAHTVVIEITSNHLHHLRGGLQSRTKYLEQTGVIQ